MFDKVLDVPTRFAQIYQVNTYDRYFQKATSLKTFSQ